MAKFNFNLRYPNADCETPLNLVIRNNNEKTVFLTDLSIHPKNWNAKTQTARETKTFRDAVNFNTELENIRNNYKSAFLEFKVIHKRQPSLIEFREYFIKDAENITQIETPKETLFTFIEKVIEQSKTRTNRRTGKTFSVNTIKVFNQCNRLLTEFNKKKYSIDFENIDLDFFHDFKAFMVKKEYSQNTIAKHFITLKSFLNEATEQGVNKNIDSTSTCGALNRLLL